MNTMHAPALSGGFHMHGMVDSVRAWLAVQFLGYAHRVSPALGLGQHYANVYEIVHGDLSDILASMNRQWSDLAFEDEDIDLFCKKYSQWLGEFGTWFVTERRRVPVVAIRFPRQNWSDRGEDVMPLSEALHVHHSALQRGLHPRLVVRAPCRCHW